MGTSPGLPEDLRLALGQDRLAELVRDVARAGDARPVASTEKLLALLTYSYAAGVYNSSEIPLELEPSDLQLLVGGHVALDETTLRQFRRRHRDQVRDCLSRVLCKAREGVGQGLHLDQGARWPSDPLAGCEKEAEERINRAIRADTFAWDD